MGCFQAFNGSSIDYQPWLLQEELVGGGLAATGPPDYLSAQTRAEKVDAAAWYYWHDEPDRALALSEEVLDPGEDDRLSRRAVAIAWSVMKDRRSSPARGFTNRHWSTWLTSTRWT